MAKGDEKLRLLLVTNSEDEQNSGHQDRTIRNCLLLPVAQISCFVMVLLFLTFIAFRVVEIQQAIKSKQKETLKSTIPGSDFCKSVNAQNMTSVAFEYLTGLKEESKTMEVKNKLYYITDRMFTDQEACTIEALLRLFQDKSVFIIEIENRTEAKYIEIDYVKFLRKEYTNLNLVKSTTNTFFKGSPFQNYINYVNKFSLFAAKVLMVWQFGGTVLSPNFLLLNRRLFDNNEGFCEVDRELFFCPNQCSAYMYQLVKTTLDVLKTANHSTSQPVKQETLQHIIDKSVADYCGDQEAPGQGCIGVNRIKEYKVCQELKRDCDYLRVHEWKLNNPDWKLFVQKFCPKIVTKYMPNLSQ